MKYLAVTPIAILLVSCSSGALDGASWAQQCEDLEQGSYRACYGPVRVNNSTDAYSYYHLSVERVGFGFIPMSEELTSKNVALDRVNPIYLTDAPAPVIEYDSPTKTITFNLGLSHPSYQIPARGTSGH